MLAQNQTDISKSIKEEQSPRLRNSRALLIVMSIIAGVIAITSLVGGVMQQFWPLYLISVLFAISFISCIFTLTSIWDAPYAIKLLLTTAALEISFVLVGGIISFVYGLPIGFVAFVVALLFAAFNPTGWLNEWFIGFGLVGLLGSALLGVLSPLPQLTTLTANIAIIVLASVSLIVLFQLIRLGLIATSLRLKLILISLFIAIVPLVVLAIINTRSITNTISTQSNDTLRIATQLTVSQIDNFIASNLTSIENEASLPAVKAYLQVNPNTRANSPEAAELAATFRSLQTKGALYTPSFGVINLNGTNIYDTDQNNVGKSELTSDYFQKVSSTHSSFVSPVEFVRGTRESYLYFITPIFNENQVILGYLRMTYDSRILQNELEKSSGIVGAHSYPMLLDENGLRLADASNPDLIYHTISTLGTDLSTQLLIAGRIPSYLSGSQIASPNEEIYNQIFINKIKPYQFFNVNLQSATTGIQDSATYGALTTQPWYVVYLQEQITLVKAQQNLTQSSAVIAVLIAGLVAILITIMSNLVTKPILDLTDTSKLISEGNLDVHVNVTSNDEIGTMGNAFNSMAQQLKSAFENMESRVRERTIELGKQNETLRYRSRQLQTVTDVARIIVSKNEMESLLTLVTELISDRFNFYHAGIFLLDEANEFAILRASNSVGGQRMLNRQHKLRVGQVGIVGYVTGSGNPRIATDVGKDAVFFNNPDLPETKSEMALPLKIEDRVIGALDIQSTESSAFTEDDINLFTTLADQISIAINNNQLLANTQKALEEAQNLHRQYLNQEWTKRAVDTGNTSYKYTAQGLTTYDEDLPEVKMVYESGRPVTHSNVQENGGNLRLSTLAVPILLRGEVIGVIHLTESKEANFSWSESELVTVQTLADQLAQTLESARLFEQTIRRADRDRRVLEITSKIRSTNDPQQMLEITLEELKRHLGASQAQIVINLPGLPLSTEQIESAHLTGNKEVQA